MVDLDTCIGELSCVLSDDVNNLLPGAAEFFVVVVSVMDMLNDG